MQGICQPTCCGFEHLAALSKKEINQNINKESAMATQQKEQICSIKSKISQIDAGRRKKQQFNQWLDEYTSYLSTLSKSEPQVARKVLEFAELVPRSSKKPYSSKVIIFANTKRHAAREV